MLWKTERADLNQALSATARLNAIYSILIPFGIL
jgi:hypothetical protein